MNELAKKNDIHNDKTILGFWIYLMTDLLLFATLFATFIVLRDNTAGGPAGSELFSLPFVFMETLILLTSSYTAGLAILNSRTKQLRKVIPWLGITFILGSIFITMELTEFALLAQEGSSWASSGFTSAYFTLVGTHGIHILIGLIWLAVMVYSLYKRGFSKANQRKLFMWSMFWHFLDIVWIFIFTIVYLMGAI